MTTVEEDSKSLHASSSSFFTSFSKEGKSLKRDEIQSDEIQHAEEAATVTGAAQSLLQPQELKQPQLVEQ